MTHAGHRAVVALAAAACVAVVLTGCDPYLPAGVQASAGGSAPPVADGKIRSVHTPGAVLDDTHLAPGACHARVKNAAGGLVLPDRTCTPGAVDPAVTQANLGKTICRTGYSKSVRPPREQTDRYKHTALLAYDQDYARSIELDHLVPLSLGGSNSTSNLWPEPNEKGASTPRNPKDDLEETLHAAVCSGTVPLAAAQRAIATDWTTAEKVLRLKH